MSIDPTLACQIPITWMVAETPVFRYHGLSYSCIANSYADMEGLIRDLPFQSPGGLDPTIAIYLLERYTGIASGDPRIMFRYATLDNRYSAPDNTPQPLIAIEPFSILTQSKESDHPLYARDGEISSSVKYNRLVDLALENQKKLDLIIECIKKGRVNNAISELEL